MKIFLYSNIEDAARENQVFGSVMRGIWAAPYVVTSGDNMGKCWLPYHGDLLNYSATGEIVDCLYEELYEDDQPTPFEGHPNIIA